MSKDIKISKGLDIKLVGQAELTTETAILSNFYVVRPEDFHLVTPKLVAKVGEKVKAGSTLFFDKANESIKFASPVSGEVVEIVRGEKRKVLAIKIQADKTQEFHDFGKLEASANAEAIKTRLLESGAWAFVKQRPYDVIAKPSSEPKSIFVSAYASAPLAADLDYTLAGKEAELQAAVSALAKLTEGKVHITVGKKSNSLYIKFLGRILQEM